MFEWDDIVILGDSFCQYRFSDDVWTSLLVSKLTGLSPLTKPVRGIGEPGTSWWTTRSALFKEVNTRDIKVLIICHTEIERLPSQHDFSLNIGSVFAPELPINPILKPTHPNKHNYIPEIKQAAQMYYTYLSFSEYHEWVWRSWARELDSFLDLHKIPYVIHLFGFSNELQGNFDNKNKYAFKNGISDTDLLWPICDDKKTPLEKISNDYQYNKNHFTTENNEKIANSLYNSLMDYKPGLRSLNLLGK